MTNWTETDNDPPITIDISRRIKPGDEAEFEEILVGMIADAMKFEGHLGANVFRPTDALQPEYRVIFKFDSTRHLEQWENSWQRHHWYRRAKPFTLEPPKIQKLTGLESWFTLPNQRSIIPPPRYKIAPAHLARHFPADYPHLLGVWNFTQFTALSVANPNSYDSTGSTDDVCVTPLLTKVFAQWLYPTKQRVHQDRTKR
jgi:uncharacterized protein